jgi:hypothetical protein
LTAISIENINKAVAEATAKIQGDNKTVQDNFKDLDNIKNSETHITSTNYVLKIVLTSIAIQSCYYMFKICFTESHNIKPLFPTYKAREQTKRSFKGKQRGNISGISTYKT